MTRLHCVSFVPWYLRVPLGGNALYVLHGNWEEISKRSCIDLLRNRDVPFERFVHSADWKERFKAHIWPEKRRRKFDDSDNSLFAGVA